MLLDIPFVSRKYPSSKRQMVISENAENVFGRVLNAQNMETCSNPLQEGGFLVMKRIEVVAFDSSEHKCAPSKHPSSSVSLCRLP